MLFGMEGLGGSYSGNEISHDLWLWLKGHNFTSLISVFGEKGPNKFSHKGMLLSFGKVASASAHPMGGGVCVLDTPVVEMTFTRSDTLPPLDPAIAWAILCR